MIRAVRNFMADDRRDFTQPDRIVLGALLALFLVVETIVVLDYSSLGDLASEADFLAEIAPAARHLASGDFDLADYPFKGPVSALALALLHLLTGPWGLGLFRTGQVLSLVTAAATLFFVYRLGLELWGRRTAVAAVVLLAVNKLFFVHAHKAGSDTIFLALVFAVVWLVLTREHTRRALVTAGILSGLAFLTRYIGVVLPVWAAVAVIVRSGDVDRRGHAVAAGWLGLGFIATALPWLVFNLIESGSLLQTSNLQNIVAHFHPDGGPPEGFGSLGAVIAHDPVHFVVHYLKSLPLVLWKDQDQILGTAMALLVAGGMVMLFAGPSDRRRGLLAGWGLVYLLIYGLVFHLARFSLPLIPVYALLAASLLDRLPRWTPVVAVGAMAFTVYWQVDFCRVAVEFYRAEQPLYLERSFGYLRDEAVRRGAEGRLRLMARKPHAAWYGNMEYVPYPGRLDGAAALLAYAKAKEADYLMVGLIEHRFYENSGFLERLAEYRGVVRVYQAGGNLIYRLNRWEAGGDFGRRPAVAALEGAWQTALAARDTQTVMDVGSRLMTTYDEDGRFGEARDVARTKLTLAGDRDMLTTRLNLAWICLKTGDLELGIEALEGQLAASGPSEDPLVTAKGAVFLGQLYHRSGQPAEARLWLERAWGLYRQLGMQEDAEPLREMLQKMSGS